MGLCRLSATFFRAVAAGFAYRYGPLSRGGLVNFCRRSAVSAVFGMSRVRYRQRLSKRGRWSTAQGSGAAGGRSAASCSGGRVFAICRSQHCATAAVLRSAKRSTAISASAALSGGSRFVPRISLRFAKAKAKTSGRKGLALPFFRGYVPSMTGEDDGVYGHTSSY